MTLFCGLEVQHVITLNVLQLSKLETWLCKRTVLSILHSA